MGAYRFLMQGRFSAVPLCFPRTSFHHLSGLGVLDIYRMHWQSVNVGALTIYPFSVFWKLSFSRTLMPNTKYGSLCVQSCQSTSQHDDAKEYLPSLPVHVIDMAYNFRLFGSMKADLDCWTSLYFG